MTNIELFDSRPARTAVCPRCQGCGNVGVRCALHPWNNFPQSRTHPVFYAAREAAELAQRADRPVAFQCIDHTVVVRPKDEPDRVARAWWLLQYGETPEATWSRR
jgi:hypothetical protein